MKALETEIQAILENMIDIVMSIDRDGLFRIVSPSVKRTLGYEPADLIGRVSFDYLHPDDRERVVLSFGKLLETDLQIETFRLRHADGRYVWVEAIGRAAWVDGRLQGIVVSSRDISDRMAAETALRESEQKYRVLVDNVLDYVTRFTPDGTVVFASDAIETVLGYRAREVTGRSCFDFIHPEDRPQIERTFQTALEAGMPGTAEGRLRGRDGRYRWFEIKGRPYRNERTGMTEIISVARDITERKEMEQALRHAEKEYRDIFHNALVAIYRTLPDGRLVMANEAAARVMGFESAEELVRSTWNVAEQIYVDPEHREQVFRMLENQDTVVTEMPYRRRSGEEFWLVNHVRAVRDEGGNFLYFEGVAMDITEKKKTEEELQRTLDNLEYLVRERTAELNEVNTALRVLLERRLEDQHVLEEKLRMNVNELVLPALDELRSCGLNTKGFHYLDLLKSNLMDITSPFISRLSSSHRNLTPREIQVASMIREGKKSKEIAELLGVSAITVDSHRISIRRKLGLAKGNVNLRSHLLSIT